MYLSTESLIMLFTALKNIDTSGTYMFRWLAKYGYSSDHAREITQPCYTAGSILNLLFLILYVSRKNTKRRLHAWSCIAVAMEVVQLTSTVVIIPYLSHRPDYVAGIYAGLVFVHAFASVSRIVFFYQFLIPMEPIRSSNGTPNSKSAPTSVQLNRIHVSEHHTSVQGTATPPPQSCENLSDPNDRLVDLESDSPQRLTNTGHNDDMQLGTKTDGYRLMRRLISAQAITFGMLTLVSLVVQQLWDYAPFWVEVMITCTALSLMFVTIHVAIRRAYDKQTTNGARPSDEDRHVEPTATESPPRKWSVLKTANYEMRSLAMARIVCVAVMRNLGVLNSFYLKDHLKKGHNYEGYFSVSQNVSVALTFLVVSRLPRLSTRIQFMAYYAGIALLLFIGITVDDPWQSPWYVYMVIQSSWHTLLSYFSIMILIDYINLISQDLRFIALLELTGFELAINIITDIVNTSVIASNNSQMKIPFLVNIGILIVGSLPLMHQTLTAKARRKRQYQHSDVGHSRTQISTGDQKLFERRVRLRVYENDDDDDRLLES